MGFLNRLNKVRYSFIIPVKDQTRLTRDCLLSWFAHTSEYLDESEIILIDNGSGAETRSFLSRLPAPMRVITSPENLGYAKSNNLAAKQAMGKYLILLNNDLILQRGWFDAMLTAAESSSNERIVGNIQISRISGKVDHVGKFFDHVGDPRHFGQFYQDLFPWDPPVDFAEFPSVTAACLLLKKSVFEGLGGFDEGYLNGFEDDDFCLRAKQKGYQIGVAFRSWVFHYVSITTGRKIHENKNRERFFSRWEQEVVDWNREHFQPTFNMLKSWSRKF